MTLTEYLKSAGRGSASRLAKSINVSPVLITQWKNNVQRVPENKCLKIEAATDGKVRCEDLRPDVAWFVIRGKAYAS